MEGGSDKCTMACTAHLVNKFASCPGDINEQLVDSSLLVN